jgi:putative transcriptional regulator
MSPLAPGLLVAAPPLGDPNFDRSVVLLAAHGPDGAFGWIINGRELMTLPELLLRAEITTDRIRTPGSVRHGGPVSPEQVWLVYRTEERLADLEGQFEVGVGITASASRKVLEAVARGDSPKSLLGLAGYAGWAPMQLENEIRSGAWLPTDVDAAIVFETPTSETWKRAYERVGATPIAFTSRTVGLA